MCQPYPRQHRRVPRQLNTPTSTVPWHGRWLAGLLLFCFPKASCHPADFALAVQTQVLEGSAGHPPCLPHRCARGTSHPGPAPSRARRPAQGTRSRRSRCSDVIYRCCGKRRGPSGVKDAHERTAGRWCFLPDTQVRARRAEHYRAVHAINTRDTGTRGPSLFLPAGSQDEESIPPSPARCWPRDAARAVGLDKSCPTPSLEWFFCTAPLPAGTLPHRLHPRSAKSSCWRWLSLGWGSARGCVVQAAESVSAQGGGDGRDSSAWVTPEPRARAAAPAPRTAWPGGYRKRCVAFSGTDTGSASCRDLCSPVVCSPCAAQTASAWSKNT